MKRYLYLMIIACSAFNARAQQEPMVSQYMFNGLFLNPAYAGSHQYFSSTLLYRNQWVNFSGAPKTALLAVDGPLMNQKMGVGLIVANDRIGVTNQSDVYANYSYILPMAGAKLAFGLKAGVSQYISKDSDLKVWDANDEEFNGTRSVLIPKFGFGVYYYKERMYAGLSIPSLLNYQGNKSIVIPISKHYYLTAGYVFEVAPKWKLKPSFLLKYQQAAPIQADMNFTAMFNDEVALGFSYRTGDAVIMMIEYQANKRFRIGYAYDVTTNVMKNYSAGSHEVMIGFDFGKDIIATKSPRFF